MTEPYVRDLRADDDPSLAVVPRLNTWLEARAYFSVRHLDDYGAELAPPGALYWALAEVYLRTGVAAYIAQVQDEAGAPYWHAPTDSGALLVRSWPGVEESPIADPLRPDYNALIGPGYAPHHGVFGWSNENGDAGFPYGGGSVVGPGGGPDAIWVHAAPTGSNGPQYSDCIAGLGWIGGTDHLTLNPVFRLTRKGAGPLPPTGQYRLANVAADGTILGYIVFTPGPPPPGGLGSLALLDGEQTVAYIAWT